MVIGAVALVACAVSLPGALDNDRGIVTAEVGVIVVTIGVGSINCPFNSFIYSVAMREFVSSMVVKIVSELIVNGIVCVVVVK